MKDYQAFDFETQWRPRERSHKLEEWEFLLVVHAVSILAILQIFESRHGHRHPILNGLSPILCRDAIDMGRCGRRSANRHTHMVILFQISAVE